MDFGLELSSSSILRQSQAAILLRSESSVGYVHLPMLLQCSQGVDLSRDDLTHEEISLVGYGAISMGAILNSFGYDDGIEIHRKLVDWLIELVTNKNIKIAAGGLLGLGELSTLPTSALSAFEFVIQSKLRHDEHPKVTLRAIALRMLVKTNPRFAEKYSNHDSCSEYHRALEFWLLDASPALRVSLLEEIDWIRLHCQIEENKGTNHRFD
jgi:hypothetical protein